KLVHKEKQRKTKKSPTEVGLFLLDVPRCYGLVVLPLVLPVPVALLPRRWWRVFCELVPEVVPEVSELVPLVPVVPAEDPLVSVPLLVPEAEDPDPLVPVVPAADPLVSPPVPEVEDPLLAEPWSEPDPVPPDAEDPEPEPLPPPWPLVVPPRF